MDCEIAAQRLVDYLLESTTPIDVPAEPGTQPIPANHLRLYHYTRVEPSVLRNTGLLLSSAQGHTYGEPNFVWASLAKPSQYKTYVEFSMAINDPRFTIMGARPDAKQGVEFYKGRSNDFTILGDVSPDEFIAIHEPWHHAYRYMIENDLVADVLAGKFDYILTGKFDDEAKAIAAIKKNFAGQYAESASSERWTYIGAIGDDGVAKVVRSSIGEWNSTYFNRKDSNHGELGWRNPQKPVIKFRSCDGTCYWWDKPTEEHKEAANQAVIDAGGSPISTHVFIDPNEARSWIDRLIFGEKAKTPVEFAWQRAHYESKGRVTLNLPNGMRLERSVGQDSSSHTWDLVSQDDDHVGEFTVGLAYDKDQVARIPWIRNSLINRAFRGHGYGRMAMKALVAHYGTLRSDLGGSTSDEAEKAWQALGAKRLMPRNRKHLDKSDYVLGRHQV